MPPDASLLVTLSIPALAAVATGALIYGLFRSDRTDGRRAALRASLVIGAWAVVASVVSLAGVLARFDARPPPLAVFLAVTLVGTVALARSRSAARVAERLPLAALVGFQAFRFPLELALHQAAREGVMPVQMSYAG